jgi:8-oxo-dGTP diphosphatase
MTISHAWKRTKFWLQWPGLVIYFLPSRRSRVLIQDGDTFFVVKGAWKRWYDDDRFGLPGGGIRRSEAPAAGAVRELEEELGIHILAEQLQSIGQGRIREYGISYYAYFFSMTLPQTTVLQLQKKEIAEVSWLAHTAVVDGTLKPEVRRALELSAKA